MERVRQNIKLESQRQAQSGPVAPTPMRVRSTATSLRVGCDVNWERVLHLSALECIMPTEFIVRALTSSNDGKTGRVVDIGGLTDGVDVTQVIRAAIVPEADPTVLDAINLRFALDAARVCGLPIQGAGTAVSETLEQVSDEERRAFHQAAIQLRGSHNKGHFIDDKLDLVPLDLANIDDQSMSSLEDLGSLCFNIYQALLYEILRDVKPASPERRAIVLKALFASPEEADLACQVLESKFKVPASVAESLDGCEEPGAFIYVPMELRAIQLVDAYFCGDESEALLSEDKEMVFGATEKVRNMIGGMNSEVEFSDEGIKSVRGKEVLKFTDSPADDIVGGACLQAFRKFLPLNYHLQYTWNPAPQRPEHEERGDSHGPSAEPRDGLNDGEQNMASGCGSPLIHSRVEARTSSSVQSVAENFIQDSLDTIRENPAEETYSNLLQNVNAQARTQQPAGGFAAWQRFNPNMQQTESHDAPPVDLDKIGDYPLNTFSPVVASAIRGLRAMPTDYICLEDAIRVVFDGKPSARIIMEKCGRARSFCESYRSALNPIDQKSLRTQTANGVPVGRLFSSIHDMIARKTTAPEPYFRLMLTAKQLQSLGSMFTARDGHVFSNSH